MAEKAKETKYERNRKQYTFTLSDQAHEFLKNNVTNASRFIDRLIESAEKGIQPSIVTVSPIGDGPVRIRTGDLRRVRATSSAPDRRGEVYPATEPKSRELSEEYSKGEPPQTLNEFYRQNKKDFVDFMKSEELTPKTIKTYISTLERLKPISTPPDIGRYEEQYGEPLTSKVEKAIGKLLKYVKMRHASTSLLGYDHTLWRIQFSNIRTPERTERRIKDLTTNEILKAYNNLDTSVQPFYAFLVYTGMRAEQAYDILKGWNDNLVECMTATVDDKTVRYCRYSTEEISRGKKYSNFAYFPPHMREILKNYSLPYSLDTIIRKIREASPNPTRPISASNIRKYNANALRKGQAIEWDVAEYIQGRRPKGVGQARYLALGDLSKEQYPKALARNMPHIVPGTPAIIIPDPEEPTEEPTEKPTEKPATTTKRKGGVPRKPVDYAKVKAMLESGKTHREIIAETGINKIRLSEFLKTHPELKRK